MLRLKPPCRVTSEGEAIWRMTVVTADGEHCIYATYMAEETAIKAYKVVTEFIGSIMNMLVFELGVDGEQRWETETSHPRLVEGDSWASGDGRQWIYDGKEWIETEHNDGIPTEQIMKGRIERKDIRPWWYSWREAFSWLWDGDDASKEKTDDDTG